MAFTTEASRRRGATYGKKTYRANGFTPASFEAFLTRTPTKPKSCLSRIQSPAKGLQHHDRLTFNGEVYDVPPSDHEGDEARLDSLLSTPAQATTKHKHMPRSAKPKSAISTARPQTASNHVPAGKRKRSFQENDEDSQHSLNLQRRDEQRRNRPVDGDPYKKKSRLVVDRHESGSEQTKCRASDHLSSSEDDVKFCDASESLQDSGAVDEMEGLEETGAEDTTELAQELPTSKHIRETTPLASTPSSQDPSNLTASSEQKATTTSRQRRIWNDLLHDREASPSSRIKDLQLTSKKKPDVTRVSNQLTTKRRLIDSLRGSDIRSIQMDSSDDEVERLNSQQEILQGDMNALSTRRNDAASSKDISAATDVEIAQARSRPPKITYGQQRSYLSEASQDLDQLLSQPLDVEVIPASSQPTQAMTVSHQRYPFDIGDDDEEASGQVRSIHELKLGGDAQRFDDQIMTIIDDLKDKTKNALSGRRASLITLAECLCNPAFKTRFVEGNHAPAAIGHCKGEFDVICCSALAASIILLLAEPVDARSVRQIHSANLITNVSSVLEDTRDVRSIARDRNSNMSRLAQQSVIGFVQKMLTSFKSNPEKDATFSPQLLAIGAIESFLRRSRETGNADLLIEPDIVSQIVSVSQESSRIAFGHSHSVKQSIQSKVSLELGLSSLESLTVSSRSAKAVSLWPTEQVHRLAGLSCDVLRLQASDKTGLRCLVLRLLLNLSNGSETNSDLFGSIDLLEPILQRVCKYFQSLDMISADEQRAPDFDELLLSLGFLFNLCEMSAESRRIICRSYGSILGDLVEVFNRQRAKVKEAQSLGESQANVAFGYLAVLLGILCQNSTGLQKIQSKLPKRDLEKLVNAIEEFTMHHQRVDQEDSNEIWTVFTNRLQSVAEMLRRSNAR